MAPARMERATQQPDGTWGCPHCATPIHPPMFACECIRTVEPAYWQIHYVCRQCHTRYAIAVTVNLSGIDAERTATMPLRSGATPVVSVGPLMSESPADFAPDAPAGVSED